MAPTDSIGHGPGRMLVISGPSGSGKSSIIHRLLMDDRFVFSVSVTTREPRPGEIDGSHYHFVSKERCRKHIEAGDFLEHAEVHGNLYGTLRGPIDEAIASGKVFVLEIDVQGALQLRELGIEAEYVFVAPPDPDTLRARLEGRGTDAPEVIERRLKKAADEMEEQGRYDHVVVNEKIDSTVAAILRIAGVEDAGAASPGGAP